MFSGDKGITWHSLDNNLTKNKRIYDLCLVKNGAYLGTQGYSVFKTDYLMDIEPPQSIPDLDIFPNPATDFIEIPVGTRRAVSEQTDVRISNIFGQNVLSVGVQNLEHLRIDVSGLVPGMFFVRIGDRVAKFIKL
jgi:hypothetical protein